MIRRLRTAHRIIWLGALIVLPAILVFGLGARRPIPLVAASRLPAAVPVGPASIWDTRAGSAVVKVVRLAADSTLTLELSNATALRGPDLLLYWTPRPLPVHAIDSSDILLGQASGQAVHLFPLPSAVLARAGSLLLFSLPLDSVLGERPLNVTAPPVP